MSRTPRKTAPDTSSTRFRYAIVDLASAPKLVPLVTGRLGHDARPLLSPSFAVDILAVGPWIVDLQRVPELEPAIDAQYRDAAWGYFVETGVDIVSVRRALRRYNLVELPSRTRPVLFRYWDPRVMDSFLKVATRQQLGVLFEFIDRIEGPAGMFDVKRPRHL